MDDKPWKTTELLLLPESELYTGTDEKLSI